MNLPLFIARRTYSVNGDKTEVSKFAIRITIADIAIGFAVMIASVCVVFGFKHAVSAKVIGFGSHIQMVSFMTLQTSESCPTQMTGSLIKVLKNTQGVEHVQRFATKQGVLKTDSDFLGVVFKGVGPDFDLTFIHQNLVEGSIPTFSSTKNSSKILLSMPMAKKSKLKTGGRILAYSIDHAEVRVRHFTIAGVYQTDLAQYDDVTCFMDLYTTMKLNGWEKNQVSGVEITVKGFSKVGETEAIFINRLNRMVGQYGETYSSKIIGDIGPQTFSWLDLLDLNVWIIPVLVIVVAGVTMTSGFLITTLERVTMAGVLKVMGAKNVMIGYTFLWFAVFTTTRGFLIGNLIGIGLALLQRYIGLVGLDPQAYYVATVPVGINIPVLLLLNVAMLLISVVALIAPNYLISHIHPAKSMRYE